MDAGILGDRIQDLLGRCQQPPSIELLSELTHSTLSLMHAMYGTDSSQEIAWRLSLDQIRGKAPPHDPNVQKQLMGATRGVLQIMIQEIDSGFIGTIRTALTAEILSGFIRLAHSVLDESGETGKDVAAVLTAAAFDNTIRRIGNKYGMEDHENIADVLEDLEKDGLLPRAQIDIARSYLNFRDMALHANWTKIEMAVVRNVLDFTENLLSMHFSWQSGSGRS
jgi:hypothetical protein